ncbi:MAG: GntR family transcriptional regulator [Alphaproteobacteria bacterium]|nr:GntR family transcriptional regulator [Alphaproteobacteria bacterium]
MGDELFASRTLSRQIADSLIADILTRRIDPGSHLREIELTRRFQASRPAIREALHLVRSTGLIDDTPWKGARVVALTRTELVDINALRGLVFGFTARRAAERISRDSHLLLVRSFGLLTAAADVSAESYELARWRLHLQLIRIGCGRHLVERLDHCWEIETIRSADQRAASVARWARLVELIGHGDADGAEAQARAMNDVASAIELDAYDRLDGAKWCT